MRFVSFVYQHQQQVGIMLEDGVADVNAILGTSFKSMLELIKNLSPDHIGKLSAVLDRRDCPLLALDEIKLLAPIPYPPRNVFCLGKNYADHAQEIKMTQISDTGIPDCPIYFTKIASPAIAHGDQIRFSPQVTQQVDYEVELAVVIGKAGRDIKAQEAEDYVFGYTIANDISARDLQGAHKQWFKGKSLDTFCPMGPVLVHKSVLPMPVELNIQCRVNGELRQDSNTREMIFDIPAIISDLSRGLTLLPGDIIMTGTPSGVGMGFEPPRLLADGDIVECYIEKIGKLVNQVVAV
ncbi:MAG: fumarylacetoacetate hydrolase family protein [Syntrophomonadaceae bacterium]|nr:fumarylacetoacetate hydrolase family protein [Syntrophomonadaceae bacterium]